MRTIRRAAILLLAGATAAPLIRSSPGIAAGEKCIVEDGFEEAAVGDVPAGWFVPPVVKRNGWSAAVVRGNAYDGEQFVEIRRDAEGSGKAFGNLLRSHDATALRGHRIRLRSQIRVTEGGRAQMWVRMDRPEGRRGAFDNMADRPVLTAQWTAAEIVADVDADAEGIHFGVMLLGAGAAAVDSFSLEDLGAAAKRPEPEGPRPLTGAGLDNLAAFTRLLGLVRHFHPSDAAADADWDVVATLGIRSVEGAEGPGGLASALQSIFGPYAPALRVVPVDAAAPPPPIRPQDARSAVVWEHVGFGTGSEESIYRSTRVRRRLVADRPLAEAEDPARPVRFELPGGVAAYLPPAVWADGDGRSLPRGDAPSTGEFPRFDGRDRATRLAAVALAWNVFQHFYPYFDVVETDWTAELVTALCRAAEDPGEKEFLSTLRRLVAALHDGHGMVRHLCDDRTATLPLLWTWAEEQLVVVDPGPASAQGLAAGTVVLAVDGVPAEQALAAAEEEISGATAGWKRWRALTEVARGRAGTSAALLCRAPDGREFDVALAHDGLSRIPAERRPSALSEIEKGIWYVDVGRISTQQLREAIEDLTKAKGVVFDFRGYPSNLDAFTLFGHLVERPVTSARWNVPQIRFPDQAQWDWGDSHWTVPPLSPRIEAKCAFLTDGRAISYAESCMGIVEHYGLGEIVGSPTAGTNGNVNALALPGGYFVSWTGMRVLKHDGSRHHGVGILPTVPVERTVDGIAAGRDEVLDRAVELLRRP